MSRQYHVRAFLRDAPNVFLRRYLAEKGLGLTVDWDELGETEIKPVFEEIRDAAPEVRAQCEADFREIDAMATEGGVKTILAEARFHGKDLTAAFGEAEGDHERVFWVFLDDPEVFRVARRRYGADSIPGRSWRKRGGLPDVAPLITRPSRQQLGESVSEYFVKKEGRGHKRQVEHYDGEDRLYWFVYPQDYARTSSEFNQEGQFEWRTRLPTFDVIFVYHRTDRSLDLFAPGSTRRTVEDLQQIWADAVLHGDLGKPSKGGVEFELDALKQRGFPLPFDPADGVEEVRLNRLRLSVTPNTRGEEDANPRITLEVNARKNPEAIYDLLDRVLGEQRLALDSVKVTQASFQFVFRSGRRRGGTETVNFDVTSPDMCSLKYDPKHEIARAYLKRWGIDVSGSTAAGSEAS